MYMIFGGQGVPWSVITQIPFGILMGAPNHGLWAPLQFYMRWDFDVANWTIIRRCWVGKRLPLSRVHSWTLRLQDQNSIFGAVTRRQRMAGTTRKFPPDLKSGRWEAHLEAFYGTREKLHFGLSLVFLAHCHLSSRFAHARGTTGTKTNRIQ